MKKLVFILMLICTLLTPVNFQAKESQVPQLEDGVLSVATNCEYSPFEYIVTENEKTDSSIPLKGSNAYCDGYDMMWLNKVGEELGVEIELQSMDFSGLIPALNSGSSDLIIAAMSPTPDRREQLDFTHNYYDENLTMSIITLKDGQYGKAKSSKDFAGATISSALGTSNEEILKTMDGIEIYNPLEGADTLIKATISGTIDGYLTDHDAAAKQVAAHDELTYVDLNDIELDPGYTGYAMAAAKGSDELVAELNTVIDSVDTKTNAQMMDEAAAKVDGSHIEVEGGFLASTWNLFTSNIALYIQGIKITLILAIAGTLLGTLLGFLLVLMRIQEIHYKDKLITRIIKKTVNVIAIVYIDLIRGTPMMVQAMLFFYGIASNIMEPNTAGIIIISFNTAAYIAEILRSGINALDKGQVEAGRSLGLSNTQVFISVVVPQTIKNTLPALANQLILNIKDSSVLSVIAVSELFYSTKQAASAGYEYTEAYFIAAVIYLILTIVLAKILNLVIKRLLHDNRSEDIMSLQTIEEAVHND